MRRFAFAFALLVAVSCGTSSSSVESAPDASAADASEGGRTCAHDVTTPLAACAAFEADASIGPADANCHASRTVLACEWSTGVRGTCGADATATVCKPPAPSGAGEAVTCTRECCPDEYAVSCSGAYTPPGCRAISGPAPGGGLVFSCCRC